MQNIKFIFWGSIAAMGALVVEMILSMIFPADTFVLTSQITTLLFLLVVTEELFKLSVLIKTVSASAFFYQSFFVSIGFASTEIVLAYFKNVGVLQNNFFLLLTGIGVIHLASGILCGYSTFNYKRTKRVLLPLLLLFLAIALHLIYNIAIIKLIKS